MDRVFLQLGSITIYWYSVTMTVAILSAAFIILRESKKHDLTDYMEDLIFYLIIFGIIGARIYYVIFNFEPYKDNILSIFKIWEGGIAIYGAIIGGFLAVLYNSKKKQESLLETTDIIAPGLIFAQAIGRWGNFFNCEAHGGETTLIFLQKLHLPNFIIEGMNINNVYYQPTFLYESLWCLLGFIILLIIRKIIKRKEGIITYSYFIWYGIGRTIIEGMRADSLYLGKIRISQLISCILIVTGIIGLIVKYIKKKKQEKAHNLNNKNSIKKEKKNER